MGDQKKSLIPFYKRREFLPLLLFIFLIAFLLLSTRMTGRPPQIESLTPKIGHPGDVMVIKGKYFGDTRNGGEVVISGYSPVSSSYLEWTDERISLRIPEDVQSGLIYIRTRNGKSKEILFTNKEQIPVVLSGPGAPGQPYIHGLGVKSGSIGTLVTLTGMNFGPKRGSSRVFFTWISGDESREYKVGAEFTFLNSSSFIPALEYDQDYLSWNDREIQVRVPDGASSGHILVITDKGESNAAYFEVKGSAGTKLFPEKRTYAVQYSIDIRDVSSSEGNSLYLWVHQIFKAPEQKEIQLVIQEPEPLFDNVHGVKLFCIQNLEEEKSYQVLQNFMFDRYSIETKVNAAKVPRSYDETRKLFKKYTSTDNDIPSDNSRIQKLGKAIVGKERNPYRKSKAIYNWVIDRLTVADAELEDDDIIDAIDTRKGDSYIYAMLFCALARSVNIPCRPVAGYLISQNLKSSRHFWAEFYLEKMGWIPVDCLLAEGKIRVSLSPEINPRTYYFGSLDFSHITFSKGLINLNQMDPDGRTVRRRDIPSMQVFHEEATGNLFSYSAYWSDIEVLGIY